MTPKRIIFMLLILVPLSFIGCGQGRYNYTMGNWGHMMGYGGGFMWIIFLIVIGVLIYFLLQSSKSKGSADRSVDNPLDILKKRYAKGEITKDEFDRMKNDIEI